MTLASVADLFTDNTTTRWRLATSLLIVLVGMAFVWVTTRIVTKGIADTHRRYLLRKAVRVLAAVAGIVALAVVWQPFAGQLGLVVGLATAGLAFALQDMLGALAGWFNIVVGGIYRVGDRVQVGGIRGDVIDFTPLRTKLMEIGSASEADSWVRGRQYTGRVVTVSNKATFTDPVFNYSSGFEFLWEEIMFPIPYDSDWEQAEAILREETARISAVEGVDEAMQAMSQRYPVGETDLDPTVYVTAKLNHLELSARFVVWLRTARTTKAELTRHVLRRFRDAGIRVASIPDVIMYEGPATTIHRAVGEPTRDTNAGHEQP